MQAAIDLISSKRKLLSYGQVAQLHSLANGLEIENEWDIDGLSSETASKLIEALEQLTSPVLPSDLDCIGR